MSYDMSSGRWLFCGIEWTVIVVGVSLSWARWPGIRCQTVFMTQLWVLAFSGVTWKHFFCEILIRHSQRIRDFFYENVLYEFTLYLLTPLNTVTQCGWLMSVMLLIASVVCTEAVDSVLHSRHHQSSPSAVHSYSVCDLRCSHADNRDAVTNMVCSTLSLC